LSFFGHQSDVELAAANACDEHCTTSLFAGGRKRHAIRGNIVESNQLAGIRSGNREILSRTTQKQKVVSDVAICCGRQRKRYCSTRTDICERLPGVRSNQRYAGCAVYQLSLTSWTSKPCHVFISVETAD
jgi:hypothetical protein